MKNLQLWRASETNRTIFKKITQNKEAQGNMLWLIGIGSLAIGVCIGIIAASRLKNTNPARITALEESLLELKTQHQKYRENVGEHFSMTAELVQHMTESYRDVYQHLAIGAQELCSGDIANKLLPASEDTVFGSASGDNSLHPPRDYAPKQNPAQTGALSEQFGIEKKKDIDS
jgi:uncharacterized protein